MPGRDRAPCSGGERHRPEGQSRHALNRVGSEVMCRVEPSFTKAIQSRLHHDASWRVAPASPRRLGWTDADCKRDRNFSFDGERHHRYLAEGS